MIDVDKRRLVSELRAQIAREMEVLAAAARDARVAATHEEAKPENDKDTRAIEAAYLAGAQASRVRDLEKAANALEFLVLRPFADDAPIALSAIAELEENGASSYVFLAPVGGGMQAVVDGVEVRVVTPLSPVGQAIVGRSAGESVELRAGAQKGPREITIVAVR